MKGDLGHLYEGHLENGECRKFLYLLPLENGNWYVGTTDNLDRRYKEHAGGEGAAWTKLHKPQSKDKMRAWTIPYFSLFQVEQMEDVLCKTMQDKFGLNNVRGGYMCMCKPVKKRLPRHVLRHHYYQAKKASPGNNKR